MKIGELRKLNKDKLNEQLEQSNETLFKLKIQRFNGDVKDSSKLLKLRKTIARTKTILKELGE